MTLQIRKDDATLGAFLRQLEDIETEVQREEYSELAFADGKIVPLDIKNKPGIMTTTYRKVSAVGQFKLVKAYANDLSQINMLSEEYSSKVYRYGGSYWISDEDIIAARMGYEYSIEQEDVSTVREAAMQKLNSLIAVGDLDLNMPGLLNHPDVLRTFSAVKIDSTSTANQILALLNDSVTAVVSLTKQIEKPDTLLLPLKQWNYLTTTRVSDNLEMTLLKQFLNNSPYIQNVTVVNDLSSSGLGGSDVMIVYNRNPKKLKAMIYEDFQFAPMERKGFGYMRPAFFRYAGLRIYRPYSVHVIENI
jgi:hypothetical protein